VRLLITGGLGFIGSHTVRAAAGGRLAGDATHVVVLDAMTYAADATRLGEAADAVRVVHGDVCDRDLVRGLVREADAVLHLAAESHVDRSIADSGAFVRTNVLGTQVVLEAVRASPGTRLVHMSTDEVYGPCERGFFDEQAPLLPRNPYAASKAAAEQLVAAYGDTYGLDAVVVRVSNVYGPDQHAEKLIPRVVGELVAGRCAPLYGDGLQQRQWVHVDDAVAALGVVLQHAGSAEVLNVGGEDIVTNLDLVHRIAEILGVDDDRVVHVPDRPGHDRRYAIDSTRLRSQLGWKPEVPFAVGLAGAVRALALRAGR
jgi:dTDP-glucose 4,6-dehydratase